ncbi:MAG: hypothetical protein A2729_04240 [Candidatus Buchananbacteria bacterium RIFCSPHIGHO2_01_FULL_39_14]|uniref:HEPN domain-containing protein n=1 Tax=Candidatus Buchananbacteria bacterium RIFCSPHIGHO2_01_FULL_39_14 TaxID=1797532 RepID=A0A1G1XUF7_9BACT|nr:MAG: hypothetical protein A2729_04240 [Candidatus Buchananbacteria bacterium RIFCSPHIGHO2_01_FULL_39_14]
MEEELRKNVKQFFQSAELVYASKDYTSATMLYFKALFVLLDLLIFNKRKSTPKDHTERFRILQRDFPEEYELLDRYFEVYRSTYSTTIDKETCEEIRTYVTKTVAKYT